MTDDVVSSRAAATGLPWFYGWNVLFVSLMSVAMTIGIVVSSFTFFVMSWMEEFGGSRAQIMLALSAAQLVSGFVFPFAGRAMDKYPIRLVGAAGLLALAGGLLLVSFATALWQLMAIYGVLLSAANALAGPLLAQTLAARWFRARRGMAIGISTLGTALGGFVFPPLVAAMLVYMGWRPSFIWLAVLVLVVGVPALLLVIANSPEDKGIAPEPEGKHAAPADAVNAWTTASILREPVFWFLVVGFLTMLIVSTGLMTNMGPYALDLGIDTQGGAFLLSVWSLMMMIGKVLFGVLADRFDHRALYFVGLAFFAGGTVLLASEPSYALMFAVVFLMGMASGGQAPLMGAMISQHFGPLAFGSVMGLYLLCIRPVAFAAPLAAWVRDHTGSYDYFWLGGLAVTVLLSPLILRVKPRPPLSAPG
ncbi:MAG: MFS transporter [Spongiibacteraceae bacterium]